MMKQIEALNKMRGCLEEEGEPALTVGRIREILNWAHVERERFGSA